MSDPLSDTFRTLVRSARTETVVQASRFIADAVPIPDEAAATIALNAVRKEFHAATHHCWAWRIGAEHPEVRSSDDGEPSGTAGRPILAALERRDITNALLIVTRYFGGTKLGTGGLARAYAEAAEAVLSCVEIETVVITANFTIAVPYEILPRVKSLIYKIGSIGEEEFGEIPRMRVTVPRSAAAGLKAAIIDASRGKAMFED